ncbi:hypothetical protein [Mucilaginibacter pedocola]|uniref:Uncharacterized protein n=1 Tax=Mucilaginibacter pedocola TaxID=1792845 RepID=A0A1S9P8U0_9SPHI|nr:hypothetical protein [Mucilaginibacter pedocola]OOQ57386.1 hypothetical protein BC343_14895 [Mucilaginibacter pedocola]
MEEKESKEPTLPQGYEYLENYTKEAQQKLRDVDAKIDALSGDRIDADAPRPFGTIKQSEAGRRGSEYARFQGEKADIEAKLNSDFDRELTHADKADNDQARAFAKNALKDGVYNKAAKNTEAFENKQTDFNEKRISAQRTDEGKESQQSASSPSRSERALANTRYQTATQMDVNNRSVERQNINIIIPVNANLSRSENALQKSNYSKGQEDADKDQSKITKEGKEPEKLEAPSRQQTLDNKSTYALEQESANNPTTEKDDNSGASKSERSPEGPSAPTNDER